MQLLLVRLLAVYTSLVSCTSLKLMTSLTNQFRAVANHSRQDRSLGQVRMLLFESTEWGVSCGQHADKDTFTGRALKHVDNVKITCHVIQGSKSTCLSCSSQCGDWRRLKSLSLNILTCARATNNTLIWGTETVMVALSALRRQCSVSNCSGECT